MLMAGVYTGIMGNPQIHPSVPSYYLKRRMTKVTFNLKDMKPMTEVERHRIESISDKDIDYSDIPPTKPEDWENAIRGAFYRPLKKSISLRLDEDVLAWFKDQGKGYQTRMNKVLRQYMVSKLVKSFYKTNSSKKRGVRTTMFNPPHPGLLISGVMTTLGIKAADLAKAMKVSVSTVTRILSGSINISADMALRLERVLSIDAALLLDMQTAYILWQARSSEKASVLDELIQSSVNSVHTFQS